MPGILIATDDGLLEVIPGEEPERILAGHQVSDVDYRDGLAAAVVPGEGVWVHLSDEWKAIARWRDIEENLDPTLPEQVPGLPPRSQLMAEVMAAMLAEQAGES